MTREEYRRKWARLVRAQESSGLTVSKWCRQNGLNEKTFRRWKKELTSKTQQTTEAPASGWCQIQTRPSSEKPASLKLVVNGQVTIELQTGFDRQLLQEALAVLCR
jgi:transposase-like protein